MNVTIRFSQEAPASSIRPRHHILLTDGSELVVDAITLTTDGVEIAGRPPARADGKRTIARYSADATVERLPDESEWVSIALTFARMRGGHHRGYIEYAPAELGAWSMLIVDSDGIFPNDGIILGNPEAAEAAHAAAAASAARAELDLDR